MVDAARDCAVFGETVVFLSYFKDLRDPRQQGKVEYPLDEILLLCLLAVLAGAETFVDIALFGRKKLGLLRRFLNDNLSLKHSDRIVVDNRPIEFAAGPSRRSMNDLQRRVGTAGAVDKA